MCNGATRRITLRMQLPSKGTNFNDIPNLPGVNNVAGGAQYMGGSTSLLAGESEVIKNY